MRLPAFAPRSAQVAALKTTSPPVAAKAVTSCWWTLTTSSRKPLNLKDCMVIRCAGLTLSAGRGATGERLEVTYHDEDGLTLTEYFPFHSPGCTALVSTTLCASSLAPRAWSPNSRPWRA